MSAYYTIGGNTISIGGAMLRELGTGSLTVSFNMDYMGGDYDRTKTFSVVVTFSRPVTYGGSTSTTHTLSMSGQNNVAIISGIPAYTTYTVTESRLPSSDIDAGYSTGTVSGGTGTIEENVESVATAQYSYRKTKAMRIKVEPWTDPTKWKWRSDVTFSQYSTDVWDVSWTGNDTIYLCKEFTHITSVLYANLRGVTDASRMFWDCANLASVSQFDADGVTNMADMFYDCPRLASVELLNTGSVTNMGGLFYGCRILHTVPLFNTGNVTNMTLMFSGCGITTIPLFDTHNVTSMGAMFSACTYLTSVPLFNTHNVTYMGEMFRQCRAITTVPLFDTSSVTEVDYMFMDCTAVESGAFALYSQMSTQTTPPASHSSCFRNCGSGTTTGAAELAQIPSDWK